MASVIESDETEVTELCLALPVIEDDMLGLSEPKLEREGGLKADTPWSESA